MAEGSSNPAREPSQWQLVAEGDWLVGQSFALYAKTVLGRDGSCDITIPGTHLSRRHAEITIAGNKLLIKDLGSANGTFVNGQRITEAAELRAGDHVKFDVLIFRVEGPGEKSDLNATMIRRVEPALRQASPKPAPVEKQWQTKPTSVGNRDKTLAFQAGGKQPTTRLWTALAALLGIGTVAALVYLLLQL